MTRSSLAAMRDAHDALIAALDSNDIDAIEVAVASFGAAVEKVRTANQSAAEGDEVQAARLRQLSDQAQMRVNFLTDMVRRRIERLSAARGRPDAFVYSREG